MKVAALLSAFDATDVSDDACKNGNSLCVTNALVKLHPVWAPHPRIGKPPAVMRRAEAGQPNVAPGGLSPSHQYGRAIEQQPIDQANGRASAGARGCQDGLNSVVAVALQKKKTTKP